MARKPNVLCAGTCGQLIWSGRGCLPPGQAMCRSCRVRLPKRTKQGQPTNAVCVFCGAGFRSVRRSNGEWTKACSKKCNGHLQAIRDGKSAIADPEKARASHRAKTHRRRSAARYTDITTDYERQLRALATQCPMPGCGAHLIDEPYLPNSKELDHMVPLGVGGTHTIGNVRIICRQCNQARPKDGSDYEGPVTLWSASPLPVARPRARRTPTPKPTCECGQVLTRGRCFACKPALLKRDWAYIHGWSMTPQEQASRALRAAEMREQNITWWEIARDLRFASASSAWHAVKSRSHA